MTVGALAMAGLAVTGCDVLGVEDPASSLSVALNVSSGVTPGVRAEIDVAGTVHRLDTAGTRPVTAPKAGEVPVSVLVLSASDTLLSDAFTQRFGPAADHWIHVWVGGPRPLGHCVGAVRGFAIATAPADSAFVIHGSLPRGAVC